MRKHNLPERRALKEAIGGRQRVGIRARWVFPVAGAPVADGVVTVAEHRIEAVSRDGPKTIVDLGNVALLPGLINAHTHLEFSNLAAPIGQAGAGFVDWIRAVMENRRHSTASPAESVAAGLAESRRHGVGALGEIAQPGWPEAPFLAGPGSTVFLELIAPTAQRVPLAIERAREHLTAKKRPWQPGLSPHAPYTVHPSLLEASIRLSASHRVPLAMHLAESAEEIEWLRSGCGPLADLLAGIEGFDARDHPAGRRPLDLLKSLGEAHRGLAIHGNYLDEAEIRFLAASADRLSVVYCPRTHDFFRHPPYPLEAMLAAGVKVCLGTDSRASAPDLSVLAEMRFVARRFSTVPRHRLLEMGTVDGAAALGLAPGAGTLAVGTPLPLAIVALPRGSAADPLELLLGSGGPVYSLGWDDAA